MLTAGLRASKAQAPSEAGAKGEVMKSLNPKCSSRNCAMYATQTFCNIADLDPKDHHWYCLADMEGECLQGESMTIEGD